MKNIQAENKALKHELDQLRSKFVAVFESMDDGVVLTDMDGNFILVNEAEVRITGFSDVEQMKKNLSYYETVFQLFYPDGRLLKVDEWPLSRVLRGEVVQNLELLGKRIDTGQEWVFNYIGKPVYDSHGAQIMCLVITQDITKHKQTERYIQQTEGRLQQLADSNVVGIIFWNINGEITYANDVFLMMVGHSRTDLDEHKIDWVGMTPQEYKAVDQAAVKDLFAFGRHLPIEKQFIRKDGSRVDVMVGSTFFKDSQTEGVGFVLDISDRKRLEKQKDEFLSVASHELKTPVTSIKAYTQFLERLAKQQGDSEYERLLNKMNRQTDRLTNLVNELLDVTRIEAGKLKLRADLLNFDEIVREIVTMMQLTIASHVFEIKGKTGALVIGDKDRIEQVLTNLLVNAVKYSPTADRVVIQLESIQNQVKVTVEDFGYGIPAEQKDLVFERFYRVQGNSLETIPGIGLGLYISNEIIKRLHGTMGVVSAVGKGSKFYFILPTAKNLSGTMPAKALSTHQ